MSKNPEIPVGIRKSGVTPSEPCIRCFRGDTKTAFAMEGSTKFLVAGLRILAGLPEDDAHAMYEAGDLPANGERVTIRLCRECGGRDGRAQVRELPEIPLYSESALSLTA